MNNLEICKIFKDDEKTFISTVFFNFKNIFDCKEVFLSPLAREILTKHNKKREEYYKKWNKAFILIFNDAIMRGIITALNWLGAFVRLILLLKI